MEMFNKLRRSHSTLSTRSGSSSLASLSDIIHEEDETLSHSSSDLQNWSLPKVNKKEVYRTSWSDKVFQFEHKVKKKKKSCVLIFFMVVNLSNALIFFFFGGGGGRGGCVMVLNYYIS